MSITCKQLLNKHPQVWHEATVHPFLEHCKKGTITSQQFNTWLVQDYLFVLNFTRMLAQVLVDAPVRHYEVLLGGLSVLKDELIWFREKAAERQLNLTIPKQKTCEQYCDYMRSLAPMPYAVQATALWAIELAYNQGWQLPGAMPKPYAEFADRWGNTGFTEYVQQLEKQADEALFTATEVVEHQAEEAFVKIAHLENKFWQMAFNATEAK